MNQLYYELIELGLTEYEAKAYKTLLENELLSASEICKKAGVPRGRIYDIINQLIDKGFCITVQGVIKKFKASDPDTAIHNILDMQWKKEARIKEIAKKLKQKFDNQKETSTPLDFITVLTSKHSQIKKFQELENNSNKFIYSFSKRPYVTSTANMNDIIEFCKPLQDRIKKGIEAKGIYESDKEYPEGFLKWIKYFEQIGEKVRICENLPMKMLIADEDIIMLSLRTEYSEKTNLISMVVEHTDLTKALINLFNFYWESSMTVKEYIKSINK